MGLVWIALSDGRDQGNPRWSGPQHRIGKLHFGCILENLYNVAAFNATCEAFALYFGCILEDLCNSLNTTARHQRRFADFSKASEAYKTTFGQTRANAW